MPECAPDLTAQRLAEAVLAGDAVAALALADRVSETWHAAGPRTRTRPRCPHGRAIPVGTVQVCKLGDWAKRNPYGLMIDVPGGGSIQIAQGSKRQMQHVQRAVLARLRNDWSVAQLVARMVRGLVPDDLLPRARGCVVSGIRSPG